MKMMPISKIAAVIENEHRDDVIPALLLVLCTLTGSREKLYKKMEEIFKRWDAEDLTIPENN